MWFEELMGFKENREDVYKNIVLENGKMKSLVNGKAYFYGDLEVLSLEALRHSVREIKGLRGRLCIRQEVADIKNLHLEKENSGALFQVASQFNLLEMASPHITPEGGVTRYAYDHTYEKWLYYSE